MPSAPGIHLNTRFHMDASYAAPQELLGRMLTPLGFEATRRRLEALGTRLNPRVLDLGGETFLVYVPDHEPDAGYRLLVFVPPWPSAQLPDGWGPVLDRYGIIFVSADRSGNDENVLARRIPLALTALANVQAAFRIDPRSVWIGGFSGGSRVALRIALAYPDLFTGAFLNAGSDTIGDTIPLPPADRLERARTSMRLVYSTGDQDSESAALDQASQASLRHWCFDNLSSLSDRGRAHQPASPAVLQRAFEELIRMSSAREENTRCAAPRATDVTHDLNAIEIALSRNDRQEARRLLLDADRRLGGLAAPWSITLADRCACGLFGKDDRAGAPPRP
ncbi:MAG TPA: hypothetical protein VGU01_05350 [Sphingomicrobium sp.]|nr:hypothetical protein [Sphingomicrobium sp.]